ncbi:MAG TPA: OmpA family protein [Longimicrobiales bacterium]|nr:OmpA family protein [Longimicrobiales bacterium]
MMQHRAVLSALIVAVALVGCRREQPPATPSPSAAGPTQTPSAVQPSGMDPESAARAETERALAILQEMIHFDFDDFSIRPDAEQVLLRKLPILQANAAVQLRIDGHADERGSPEYNQALGQRRANAARDFLVAHGVSSARLATTSFGEERPLQMGSNEAAWAVNRRAEFQVTAGADRVVLPASD